jgi:O-antigen/teichoic acid export membrane protein
MYTHLADFLHKKYRIDAHYFLKGGFWLSVGQAATIGFGLITTALLAHFLTPTDYGVYRYLISISVILSAFSLSGLGQSITQTAAKKYEGFYTATLKINFLYSLAITAAGLVGFGYYWIKGNELLALGCLLVAIFQPAITVYQNTSSLLQGSQRFRESTTLHLLRTSLSTVISVVTLLLTKNVLLLFASYLLANLFINVLSHLLYRPRTTEVPEDILKKYLAYAKHTSVRNVISNIAQRADMIIVFTQLGAAELALYSIATVIPEQIKGSFKNLASLLLPKYAKHESHNIIMQGLPKRSLQLFVVLTLITVGYIICAPFVYSLFFPKYPDAGFLSQLLALSFPGMVAILPASLLQSQLKERRLYEVQTLETITTILCSLILTVQFGVIGAVLSKVLARYLTLGYNFFLIYKE